MNAGLMNHRSYTHMLHIYIEKLEAHRIRYKDATLYIHFLSSMPPVEESLIMWLVSFPALALKDVRRLRQGNPKPLF